jgi:hypothetical protein
MKAHDPDDPTTPAATEEEALEAQWWAVITANERAFWHERAGNDDPHAAWETFKAYRPGEEEPRTPARAVP